MQGNNVTRIDVFAELTFPKGTFDYEKCKQLLDDHYNSFVGFCDAVKVVPEEISEMSFIDVNKETGSVIFEVTLNDGQKMQFEK